MNVEERLERLERQNQWLRRGVLSLLLVIGATLVMGQAGPKNGELVGRRLILKDKDGKVLVELGPSGKGNALHIHGADSRGSVNLGFLKTIRGETRAILGITSADGMCQLTGDRLLIGSGGGPKAVLYAPTKRSASLSLKSAGGIEWEVLLEADQDGGKVTLREQRRRAQSPRGKSQILKPSAVTLMDENGKIVWTAPKR